MLKKLSKNIGHEAMKSTFVDVGWEKVEESIFNFYGEKFVEGDDYEERRIISEGDLKRNLKTIKEATVHADFVFVYLHQHHWDPDWQKTPDWMQDFAHKCIDKGATAFIGHGVPMLHGIEIYKKCPIFYSLGNFIFHIWSPPRYKDPRIWRSVVAISYFKESELQSIELYPIALGGERALVNEDYKHRTVPLLVHGGYGRNILKRLSEQSKSFGTEINIVNDKGEIRLQG